MNIYFEIPSFFRKTICLVCGIWLLSFASLAQTIGGIGAMLKIDSADNFLMPVIISVLPNSPASASLKEKLFILKVNDVSCGNKTIDEVVGMIRGVVGTKVKLTVADDKKGKHAKECDLVRGAIQAGGNEAQADPIAAFNSECEMKIRQLRKAEHITIVKTYNSDCGNFFFNFNADAGLYKVKLYAMTEKGAAANDISALIFDSKDEAGAIRLAKGPTNESGSVSVCEWSGLMTFPRAGVGVVSTKILPTADNSKCKALFIVVYN